MTFYILLTALVVYVINPTKCDFLESTLKKACELASQTIYGAANSDEKAEIIKKVNEIWPIFSPTENIDYDFKKVVTYTLKYMVTHDDFRLCADISPETRQHLLHQLNLTQFATTTQSTVTSPAKTQPIKTYMINSMLNKFNKLLKKSLKNVTNAKEQVKTMYSIKKRLEAALHHEQPESAQNEVDYESEPNEPDLLIFAPSNTLVVEHTVEPEDNEQHAKRRDLEIIDGIQSLVKAESHKTLSQSKVVATTREPSVKKNNCPELVSTTCKQLTLDNHFQCKVDNLMIPIQHVCDDSVDCADGSDERNCIRYVSEKIQNSTKVVNYVNSAKDCYFNLLNQSLMVSQSRMLSEVLKKQIAFIEKYTIRGDVHNLRDTPYENIKEVVAEVLAIVRTFSATMKSTLCGGGEGHGDHEAVPNHVKTRRSYQLINHAHPLHTSLGDCVCDNHSCANDTCKPTCKKICYQMYVLSRFDCTAMKEGLVGVSLNKICDGRIDCVGGTDENDCYYAPPEGRVIFKQATEMIQRKLYLRYYEVARSKLVLLQIAIHKFQKHAMNLNRNHQMHIMERNNLFSMFADIYLDLLEEYKNLQRADDSYVFLKALSNKLVSGLKKFYKYVEAPMQVDLCKCQGRKCQANCTLACSHLCSVRDLLTTFPCDANRSRTLQIESICNGKMQCPNGEDEVDCKKAVCRRRHLRLLRQKLLLVTKKFEQSALEDSLRLWREKAKTRIILAEKKNSLKPMNFKFLIYEILNDLAETYANYTAMDPSIALRDDDLKRHIRQRRIEDTALEIMKCSRLCMEHKH